MATPTQVARRKPSKPVGIVMRPVQMDLFSQVAEDPDNRYINTIGLWDMAPRFVFLTDVDPKLGPRKYLDTVERHFFYDGVPYTLYLKPARIKRDGEEIEVYPGEREQLVEDVIRRIAVERGRLDMESQDLVRLSCSLYEIRRELEDTNHSFRTTEIREALMILRHAEVQIVRVDDGAGGKVTNVIATSSFPQIAFRDSSDDANQTTIQFNWVVAAALKTLQFRRINYDAIMSIDDVYSRWLYKRLYLSALYHDRGVDSVQMIYASEIQRDSGMARWKRWSNALARITKAVEYLRAKGIIDEFSKEEIIVQRRKEDVQYVIHLAGKVVDEIRQSIEKSREAKEDYVAVVGSEPTTFVPLDPSKQQNLNQRRMRRVAAR